MKKLFLLLLPLLAAGWLLSLGGCDKDPKTTITVQEYGTHTPIAGATVTLGDCDSDPNGNVGCTNILSGTTDEHGQFKTDETAFAAAASAEGFWKSGDDFIVINAASGLSQIPNLIYLYPHAWLEVTVKNESGAYMITVPGDWPIGTNTKVLIGKGEQGTFTVFRQGNKTMRYIFSVWENSVKPIEDLSYVQVLKNNGEPILINNTPADWFEIFLKGHETTKITITY